MLHRVFDLTQYQKTDEGAAFGSQHGPSSGRWLRRRKNDGALNRVPERFYPRMWHVLERCGGICFGSQCISRDPLVYEKTPEEINFAIAIETHLSVIGDPAIRHLAAESLMIVWTLMDRHPDSPIATNQIDIQAIMVQAMVEFWEWYCREHHHHIRRENSSSGDKTKASSAETDTLMRRPHQSAEEHFHANESKARQFFYDLAVEGPHGTTSFLARSVLKASGMEVKDEWVQECVQASSIYS